MTRSTPRPLARKNETTTPPFLQSLDNLDWSRLIHINILFDAKRLNHHLLFILEPELSLLEKVGRFQFATSINKTDGLIPTYATATLAIFDIVSSLSFSLGYTFALLQRNGLAFHFARGSVPP
jgi:hypothetical protein